MKKILVLGGIPHMIDIVKKINHLGYYSIVIDNNPLSPAKKIADKSFDISTTDIESINKLVSDEGIDGVFNAFEDTNTWIAEKISKSNNLSFYASLEQLQIASDKENFKNYCKKYKVPVIKEYELEEVQNIKFGDFPIIVKPTDSYGSRGISVCNTKNELDLSIKEAKEFSKENSIIIEKFINNNVGVELYYTIKNGEIFLSAMSDRYVFKIDQKAPPLPSATFFNSKYLNIYLNNYHELYINMLESLNLRNCVVAIQALIEDDKIYAYEMSMRLTGEKHYELINGQNPDMDILAFMINNCINEDDSSTVYNEMLTKPSCNLALFCEPGKIDKIEGFDQICLDSNIISKMLFFEEGEKILKTNNYGQMILRLNIQSETSDELKETIVNILNNFRVLDSKGNNIIYKTDDFLDFFRR